MILRGIVFLLVCGAIAISCKNEPYEKAELAVTTVTNHDSSTSLNYKYKGQQLYTFQSLKSSAAITSMRFDYSGDQLVNILIDSVTVDTVTSYKVDTFYGYGTSTVIDSTKLYVDTTAAVTLVAVRTVTYDENSKPILVDLKLFPATGMTEQTATLTWDGGDVVRLVTTNVNTGATLDLSISHDSKNGVYKFSADYIYTLPLQKLYWLSEHNPVAFDNGTTTKKYNFFYNKFDYPTSFRSEVNTQFGVTYLNR
jgi:hypothetical protein